MPTLSDWKKVYDGWAGLDPNCASTGERRDDTELDALASALATWLELTGKERVLDVGCASASLTSRYAPRARSVTGVDFSEPLLADARRRHAGSNMEFIHSEAASLPFPDDSFDRICCFGVVLTLPDHEYARRSVAEMVRVLKPGGLMLLGSLPDITRKEAFFDLLDERLPWYRRSLPRSVRWSLKRLLKPGSKPGQTRILWFDLLTERQHLAEQGLSVEVRTDPDYADYPRYRSSLLVRKPR